MNFIAGFFLLLGMSEENAFWLFIATVQFILPQDYFATNLLGVQTDARILTHLLTSKLPRIARQFEQLQVPVPLAVISWFLVGFIDILPSKVRWLLFVLAMC